MSKHQSPIRAFTIHVVFAVPSAIGTTAVDLTCESHEEAQAILEQIEDCLVNEQPIKIKHGTFHQTLISSKSFLYAQLELKQVNKLSEFND